MGLSVLSLAVVLAATATPIPHVSSPLRVPAPPIRALGDGTFLAEQGSPGLRTTLSSSGTLSLTGRDRADVRLTSFGRSGGLRAVPVAAAARLGESESQAPKLSFRRAGIDEWYVNTPLGLQQWFRIGARPAGKGELTIRLGVSGLTPTTDGQDRILLKRDDRAAFAYGGIKAWDASGRALSARLAAGPASIDLVVDDADAQYPVTIDPLWTLAGGSAAPEGAFFGYWCRSVAARDGRFVGGLPGSSSSGVSNGGAAYVFTRGWNGVFAQEAKLAPPISVVNGGFGQAVAMTGTSRAIVGELNGARAFIFDRQSNGTWTLSATLTDPNGQADGGFGRSVDIDGDRAIVGAPLEDLNGEEDCGAAYIYERQSNGTWTLQDEIAQGLTAAFESAGTNVRISGSRAAISSPTAGSAGTVWTFTRQSATSWPARITLPAPTVAGTCVEFGYSLDLDGTTLAIGDPKFKDSSNVEQGAYFVYRLSGTTGIVQEAFDWAGQANARLGNAIQVDGNNLLLGVEGLDVGSFTANGGTIMISRSIAGTWTATQIITGSGGSNLNLGRSLALGGDTAVIASPDYGNGYGVEYDWILPTMSASIDVPWRTGGKPVTLSLGMNQDADSGGTSVSFSSGSAALIAPASTSFSSGTHETTVTVDTLPVAVDTVASVTATNGRGAVATATVEIRAPRVGRVDLDKTILRAGETAKATVVLNGPAPTGGFEATVSATAGVSLSTTSVTIPAGKTRAVVTVTALPVATDTGVTIGAEPVYVPKTASLTVLAGRTVTALGLEYPSITIGTSTNATVQLSEAAGAGGVSVPVVYSGAASGPASVVVPQGQTSATFAVNGSTTAGSGTVSVTLGGVTKAQTLNVVKPVLLTVGLSPTMVTGGGSSIGTVTLEKPAPSGGVVILLSSSATNLATVPTMVTIPGGATSATFTVNTVAVTSTKTVSIVAKAPGGGNRGAYLTINP